MSDKGSPSCYITLDTRYM